ncbi:MAG: hypothetical protein HW390_1667 [Candidatus Brocadiaceae bacterium]|nr:hypothetical protein [Candidatus Brocadiaceae bacterium]
MTEQSLTGENLLTMSQVVQILNVARHKLNYLFDSRKLKAEDFLKLPNGERVYRQSDLEEIKKALFEVGTK